MIKSTTQEKLNLDLTQSVEQSREMAPSSKFVRQFVSLNLNDFERYDTVSGKAPVKLLQ